MSGAGATQSHATCLKSREEGYLSSPPPHPRQLPPPALLNNLTYLSLLESSMPWRKGQSVNEVTGRPPSPLQSLPSPPSTLC